MKNTYYFYKCITNKLKDNLLIMNENSDEVYKLDFNEIFLKLDNDSKKILDNLFDHAIIYDKDYINRLVFTSFMATSSLNIPLMQESYYVRGTIFKKYLTLNHNGKKLDIELSKKDLLNYKKNNNSNRKKLVNIKSNSIDDKLKKHFPNINDDDLYIFSVKQLHYTNDTEFLLAFLNWLFSTNDTLYIKKCVCENYYVATKADNKYCKRKRTIEDDKEYGCNEFSAKFKKTYKYKQFKKKDKSFLNKINFNFNKTNLSEEYIEEYLKERDKKINEAVKNNDLSILTNFIDNYENDNPFK